MRKGKVLAVYYSDRNAVRALLTYSFFRIEQVRNKRGDDVQMPSVVSHYNRSVGGMNLSNQLVCEYEG